MSASWSHRRSFLGAIAVIVALTGATACSPAPTGPSWTPTLVGWSGTTGAFVERPLAATPAQWVAVIEMSPTTGPTATSTNLLLFPRTGVDGAPAATPSQTIALDDNVAGLSMSDHVIAVRSRSAIAGLDTVHLYGVDPATNVWSQSLGLPRGLDVNAVVVMDVTDTALVLGITPSPNSLSGVGAVLVYPLTVSSTTGAISGSFLTAASLSPDPAWTASDRAGFGRVVSIEHDWLAVSSGQDHVSVYHRTAPTTWVPDFVMTNPITPGNDGRFARSLSLDDDGATPRLLVGTQGGFSGFGGVPTAGRAELLTRRAVGGWDLTSTISPRDGSALGGFALGVEASLDGDRAVVGYYWAQLPGTGGFAGSDDYRLELWNFGATPSFEAELSVLAPYGGVAQPGQTQAVAVGARLAGSHVSAVSWDVFGSAVPTHFSALSWDRHPA